MSKRLYIVLCYLALCGLFSVTAKALNKSVCFTGNGYISPGAFYIESNVATVEFWTFKETWQVSSQEVLLSNFENGGWEFAVNSTSVMLKAFLDGVQQTISFPVLGMTGGWHHFAMTFDGNYLRFYMDGYQRGYVFDFKSVLTKPLSDTWLSIGCESMVNGATGQNFNGEVDEVRIWNKCLSSSDVRNWMHREVTDSIKPDYIQNLVLYYPFNEPDIYLDNNQILNSVTGYNLELYQNIISDISSVPVILSDDELQSTRALWSAFSQGTYSEPSGGLNLGITDYNEFDIREADIFGHDGGTGIITVGTNDGVDLQANRVWKIITNHDDEHPSLRFQIFDAGAGALFYDCLPVNNYKLMYKSSVEDTFMIIDEADNMEGNLIFFNNIDVKSGYFTIARDNDIPTVISATEVLNISTTSADFGGAVGCDGGANVSAFGVCWNTSGSATLDDSYTIDGSGTGEFTSHLDSLEPGIVYYIRAYATNSEGTAYGEEMVFQTNKMYQSVVFPEIPVKEYGAPDFDPGAFASSGLPVIYTSSDSDVATVTDEEKLHITGIGSTTIWVYQPGNDNYSPSSYKKMILTVNKAILKVSADDKTITYGDSLPALTYTITGFAGNEDTSVLTSMPQINSNAQDMADAGNYTISTSGGEAENYTFEHINGTLIVKKAELDIEALDQHITYGDSLPEAQYLISGFVNGEDTTVLDSIPEISYVAAELIPEAGTYEIAITGGGALNYELNYNNATLTVDRGLLNVSAENSQIVYGDNIPELEYAISGFIPKDTVYELDVQPEITTDASLFSDAGVYPITVTGAIDKNYDFRYESGNLTINKAVITAKAEDTTIVYGTEPDSFSYTVLGKIESDPNPVFEYSPQLTTDAGDYCNVGSYNIFIGSGVSQNYEPEYINGVLTVIKAIPEISELPETTPIAEGQSLISAQILGGLTTTNGSYKFSDPEYVPDSTGEEVDILFIPEDTLNYTTVKMKVGIIISTKTSVILPKNNAMAVQPNPVLRCFMLSNVEPGKIVQIFDIYGNLRKTIYWEGNVIDVSEFDPDIYMVSTENQMIKFIKQ
ncbi:MBG domain-containing protein [Saccharicrinis sp. FJH2]|uniref:MBG domain-containing protein n=1 Tax=Saccharicrinis sp. FJH65 TaxID=3344659 RepID=UPI0035F49CB0